ncbi:M15 family metallopeptidase [Rubrobacter indicoceani]|uniref:M15 family metallopeptidase n=1 Tax=Rubrobacter indicoceani TaxID=2051957 RepID=UPI000E5A6E07|nr:M15 family metallopeptidase [Rubrobacter indicoceani]
MSNGAYRNGGRGSARRGFAARQRQRLRRRIALLAVLCVAVVIFGLVFAGVKGAMRAMEERSARTEPPSATGETAEGGTRQAGSAPEAKERTELAAAKTCDALDVLVDPRHPLPDWYAPDDLVYILGYGVPTTSGDLPLRREAAENLGELSAAAAAAGEEVLVSSAYRSYAEQQEIFQHYTGIYGDWVENVSAPPGQSQHQLGTTVDFTSSEVGYELLPAFGQTAASRWLAENAWRYGFINTYPVEDSAGTGRQAEPWEYRYVGVKRAQAIHDSGLSLRKYLRQNGKAPCEAA